MKKLHEHLVKKSPLYKEWHDNPGHEFIHMGFALLIVAFVLSMLLTATATKATSLSVPVTASVSQYSSLPVDTAALTSTTPAATQPTLNSTIGKNIVLVKNANVRVTAVANSETLIGMQKVGAKGVIKAGPVKGSDGTWWVVDFATGSDGWVLADNFKLVTSK